VADLWTTDVLIAATGGRLSGSVAGALDGVSIDTRTLVPGDIFVAIEGRTHDGHAFVAKAFEAGAGLAIVRAGAVDPQAGPLLEVDDPLTALEGIGRAGRARSGARIIAVTGSVGKTGTKEALRLALAKDGTVHASAASYNNHWGVPLSLSRLPADARYGVFEIGMNHPGEITPLARMIRPHVAVITTVAPVHLGNFASVDEIADAKAEVFAGLAPGGTAVLNRDNPYYDRLREAALAAGAGRVVGFGEHDRAEARLEKVVLHATCSCVSASICGHKVTYKLGAPGRHLVMNSLAVLAVVDCVGADLALAALALADMSAPKGRGARHRLAIGRGYFTLVDESYNANPVSMRAAIATLGTAKPGPRGRRIAVLGDMLELGEAAPRLHAELASALDDAGIDLVYACGPNMARLWEALPQARRGVHADDAAGLAETVADTIEAGDVVMIKGSLGSRMGPLVEMLLARHPALTGDPLEPAKG
jgi:UDP-N-acetylmuramoyl-tripeptide--D-alanyl-D-alanine ligase